MKILIVSDEENQSLWDYYHPGKLNGYELILSCGDLKPEYLSFLVTMAPCPLFYIHGNHDGRYEAKPPEGCDCIEDKLTVYKGLRILGLGGCYRYSESQHQYTQKQMAKRVQKLQRAIEAVGGVDLVITHAAPLGVGDLEDPPHRGFEAFLQLMDKYQPKYLCHGHIHMNYGFHIPRVHEYADTKVVNCCGKYELDIAPSLSISKPSWLRRLYLSIFVKNLEIISL